ncbi:hypothetical protein AAFF_G00274170 [Aldrovandia affinis]|uniref:Uncharacterized protein n=1 Tax=Aldrovandia affinis TaxID=143900 RepID=A0AAD7SRZ7_9TELE|nr:hypothetical protein AAFF_G00274170 [Aldrovandia affinis]
MFPCGYTHHIDRASVQGRAPILSTEVLPSSEFTPARGRGYAETARSDDSPTQRSTVEHYRAFLPQQEEEHS